MMIASRNGMAVNDTRPAWFGKNAFTLDLSGISEPYDFHFTEGAFAWRSSDTQSAVFLATGSSSFTIDWGDGSQEEEYTASTKEGMHHEYSTQGVYTVIISDDINTYSVNGCQYLSSIVSCGSKNSLSGFYWQGKSGNWKRLFGSSPNLSYVDFSTSSCIDFYNLLVSCPNLETLLLPDNTENIGPDVYTTWGSSTKISGDVVLPSGLKYIGGNAFRGCPLITSLDVPAGFLEINGNYPFYNQGFDLIMRPTTPPTCSANGLVGFRGNIYVPADSVNDYKAASGWSDFSSVIYPIGS